MSDNEKAFEAFRISPIAYDVYDEYYYTIIDRFIKGSRFPYRNRVVFDDDRGNKWCLVFECPSKAYAKKGKVRTFCYSIYNVVKNKKDGNGGKGILVFDPVYMHRFCNDESDRYVAVMDIVPHAFNRYTERHLKPLGMENIEFERKVEMLMYGWRYFDISGDKSSEKHTDKGFAPYDVFMKDGGLLRGQFVNNVLIRFFTYLSKDMLFDEQKEWYDEQMKEFWSLKRNGELI